MNSQSNSSSSIVKLGLWGKRYRESDGNAWDDGGCFTGIRAITIQYSNFVETIEVKYDLFGETVRGQKHGGCAQKFEPITREIELDFPREFLTRLSGNHDGQTITRLTFWSNMGKKYGPYGYGYSSVPFNCSVEGGKGAIVGFSGSSGWYLDSIGIYVAVLCPATEFFEEMNKQRVVAYRTPQQLPAHYTLRG